MSFYYALSTCQFEMECYILRIIVKQFNVIFFSRMKLKTDRCIRIVSSTIQTQQKFPVLWSAPVHFGFYFPVKLTLPKLLRVYEISPSLLNLTLVMYFSFQSTYCVVDVLGESIFGHDFGNISLNIKPPWEKVLFTWEKAKIIKTMNACFR